jgi:hypothetical protein
MSEEQQKVLRDFIYFIEESGELSGNDIAFLKGSYYDFKKYQKEIKEK